MSQNNESISDMIDSLNIQIEINNIVIDGLSEDMCSARQDVHKLYKDINILQKELDSYSSELSVDQSDSITAKDIVSQSTKQQISDLVDRIHRLENQITNYQNGINMLQDKNKVNSIRINELCK